MQRILVVANRTLGGERLLELLRDRAARDTCTVHVLVPVDQAASDVDLHSHEGDTEAAEARLEAALEAFRSIEGMEADGELGDRPVDACLDALDARPYDEVIVSTLPPGVSRWLGLDIVSRLKRATDGRVPISHVFGAGDA